MWSLVATMAAATVAVAVVQRLQDRTDPQDRPVSAVLDEATNILAARVRAQWEEDRVLPTGT